MLDVDFVQPYAYLFISKYILRFYTLTRHILLYTFLCVYFKPLSGNTNPAYRLIPTSRAISLHMLCGIFNYI